MTSLVVIRLRSLATLREAPENSTLFHIRFITIAPAPLHLETTCRTCIRKTVYQYAILLVIMTHTKSESGLRIFHCCLMYMSIRRVLVLQVHCCCNSPYICILCITSSQFCLCIKNLT